MNNSPSAQAPSSFDYKGWREHFITTVMRIACVLGVAIIAASFSTATTADRILFIGLYIILLIITILPVQYKIRAFVLLLMVFTIGINSILAWGPWLDGSIFFITFIALSALLFDQRVDVIALGVSIFTFALIAALQFLGGYEFTAPNVPETTLLDWVAYTVDLAIPGIILIIAIGQFKKEFMHVIQNMQNTFETLTTERAQLESRVQERTEELAARATQLRSSASISRTIAELQDIAELMESTVNLTSEHFGYYHVGLYLLDERKRLAFLQASSSADGKRLVGEGFRVEPDRLNPIHRVVENNRPYLASDIDPLNFIREANFPLTRSRMILPLTVRNNVIGLLDMHSDQPQSFTVQDAEILQTLADLIAISIDNVRLISETKNLLHQLETNTSAQTRETWSKFTSRHKPAYQYTPAGVRPIFGKNKKDNTDGLRIPLMLHKQHIGNITLKRKGAAAEWSERERALIEKVADQVSLALENSRLVDETQKRAARDQVIANISARVRETLDIEAVLRTAATELRKAFDLKEAEISVGTLQVENSAVEKDTDSAQLK